MKNRIITFLLLLLAGCLGCGVCQAGELVISSSLQGSKVGVGEKFSIFIKAINLQGDHLDISQKPQGCEIIYKSTSASYTVVNGKSENVTQLTLTCKATTPGKYKFGPVKIGKSASNVLSYEVTSAPQSKTSAGSSGGSGAGQTKTGNGSSGQGIGSFDPNGGPVFIGKGNEEIFMRASVSKTSVYEQEAIVYTVKLYTTYEVIKFLGATAAPKFDGFVVEESDDVSKSFAFEDHNGKVYKTAVIARYVIFPQKPGKLKIQGNTYTVSTDTYNYYHDSYMYFQNMVVKYPIQLNVTPNDLVIDVKPLPTPVPANFIGGVGQFAISAEMPQTSLSTNSAASLVYHVSGQGNIKYVKLPELSTFLPKQFEVYSPKENVDAKVAGNNVSGTANFDYLIMPQEAGDFSIPPIEFYYFNPETGNYVPVKTKGFDVTVALGKSSDKSQQAASFNPELMKVQDLMRKIPVPYIDTILYWLWYVIPFMIFVFCLGSYRKYLRDHEDLQLLRSKQANKMAVKRLNKAFQFMKGKQEEQFYNEMLSALWGYLGDKLQMPPSELTRSNVGEEFSKHGIQESTFMPILNLIDECEYAKYTPVSREANMRQLYSDAVDSLAEVESEFNNMKKKSDAAPKDDDDDDEN